MEMAGSAWCCGGGRLISGFLILGLTTFSHSSSPIVARPPAPSAAQLSNAQRHLANSRPDEVDCAVPAFRRPP